MARAKHVTNELLAKVDSKPPIRQRRLHRRHLGCVAPAGPRFSGSRGPARVTARDDGFWAWPRPLSPQPEASSPGQLGPGLGPRGVRKALLTRCAESRSFPPAPRREACGESVRDSAVIEARSGTAACHLRRNLVVAKAASPTAGDRQPLAGCDGDQPSNRSRSRAESLPPLGCRDCRELFMRASGDAGRRRVGPTVTFP